MANNISQPQTLDPPKEKEIEKTTLKVIVLGDPNAGKSSTLRRFVNQNFSDKYKASIGADFYNKEVIIDGVPVTLELWDSAGQARFQTMSKAFYRGADCCVFIFDVTSLASFQSLERFRNEFHLEAGLKEDELKEFPFILLGNKVDLANARTVSVEQASAWAMERYIPYLETSAKEDTNVEKAFLSVVRKAIDRRKSKNIQKEKDPTVLKLQDLDELEKQQEQAKKTQACQC